MMKNKTHLLADGTDAYADTRELSLQLSAYMLWLGGAASTVEQTYVLAEQALLSGKALAKFYELCEIHGGSLKDLPRPQNKIDVLANKSGYVGEMCTEAIGYACVKMNVQQREAFGKPLSKMQVIRHKLANMAMHPIA